MTVRKRKPSRRHKRAPTRAETPRAVIACTPTGDKFTLLASVLEQAGFWPHLRLMQQRAGVSADAFAILIKPDLEMFDAGGPTGTDPELVEHLVDLLHDQGYVHVAVGDARNAWDRWLENRDVCVLAELVGYHYVTPQGRAYQVVDLSDDLVPVPFPSDGVLHGVGLGRTWVEAGYRINFAKNKTHEEFGYALCLQNLLGVLPLRDKEYHYRHRLQPWDLCLELHRQTPAQFNLIDAFVSNHGSESPRVARVLETRTLIAGADVILTDWAAALKMGADPYVSPINGKALRDVGLPRHYEIAGDLTPYAGWINVSPLVADSVRLRNESPALSRLVKPWLQSVNRDLFPFKDLRNDRINAVSSRYLANIDENAAEFWTLVGLNYLLAFAHRSLEAYQIGYGKERLRWKETPLDFDATSFSHADYAAVVDYMEPLQRIIRDTPPEPNGLRWRYLDGSVLFEFSHLTPVPFELFVARVDIAKAVQSMNDYIGGACVPVERNRAGKVIYQAERNVYLPQPNWIAFFGGKHIDVGKLEYIKYRRRTQKIFWRTIKSSNNSAEFDDGIVTFAAEGREQTRVTIVARQKFTLPLFWQVVNIELAPKLKDFLVVDAYTRYFRQTIANFESQYQGREFRVGHPWDLAQGEMEGGSGADPHLEKFVEMFGSFGTAFGRNFGSLFSGMRASGRITPAAVSSDAGTVDGEGFRHFGGGTTTGDAAGEPFDLADLFTRAGRETTTFFTDLADAVRKDIDLAVAQGAGNGIAIR